MLHCTCSLKMFNKMKCVREVFTTILKFAILVSVAQNYLTRSCLAQKDEDHKLSEEVLKLGDELYFACLREAKFISDSMAKNQSLPNVPNRDIKDEDVIFWLYTRKNPNIPQNLTASDPNTLRTSYFDSSKLTVFSIPGARDPAKDYAEVPYKILPSMDVNVIVTNWDSFSFYNGTFVVNRTVPLLAKICIKMINQFIEAGSTAEQMYVIGFSAGGQTAGFIGKGIKNLGRILGVDPGARCYTYQPESMKLNKNDALSVQILHCTGGVLGVPPSYTVGADFYYSGGIFLPPCRNISSPYQTGICSHILCKYYFFDSLTNFNISFGIKCDSYKDYEKGHCNAGRTEIAGFYSRKTAQGLFFIEKDPYRIVNRSDYKEWF